MSTVVSILAFIVAIGVLVTVHEFGHFLIARLCGVKILTFSVGFGRPIYQWSRGETTWQLAMIPLGGFVRMLDEREGSVAPDERHRAFNNRSVVERMAIVMAGPIANLLLAFLLYWMVFMAGVDVLIPRIGSVVPHSMAAESGLLVGDEVRSVNGKRITSWDELRLAMIDTATAGKSAEIAVTHATGHAGTIVLPLTKLSAAEAERDATSAAGISPVRFLLALQFLDPAGAGNKGGLRAGDELVSTDGVALHDWFEFVDAVKSHPGKKMSLLIRRGGELKTLEIIPSAASDGVRQSGHIGAAPQIDQNALQALRAVQRFGPLAAVWPAMNKTVDGVGLTVKMLWRMVTGSVSTRQLSGPVTMARYAGESASLGVQAYLQYLCLISISLGVLNLLPIPVLDGGHLMYYSAELLRGKPIPVWLMEIGQRAGIGILAFLMVFALINDLIRSSGG